MTKPLALVIYERLLPGTQLVNRLQDLGYRVMTLADPTQLEVAAEGNKPMLVLADFSQHEKSLAAAVQALRKNPNTSHLPIIAYCEKPDTCLAAQAGATLVAGNAAIAAHLPEFLEQALRLD